MTICVSEYRSLLISLWIARVQHRLFPPISSAALGAVPAGSQGGGRGCVCCVRANEPFHKDPVVPGAPSPDDYTHSGYDRGHMAPAGDMQWSAAALAASYAMTNVCPQHPHCNRRTLRQLEELIRSWARNEKELYVISGPVFRENPITIGNGTIPVPEAFYKIVYDVTPPQKVIAFLIPNRETKQPLYALTVTVREVEKVTGYDFSTFCRSRLRKGWN